MAALILSLCLLAANAAPSPAPPERELQAINRSLQEIVLLLKEQAHRQQTDLLMKRMETYSRALATQEQELRRAIADRTALSQELEGIEARMDQIRSDSDPGQDAGGGLPIPKEALAPLRAELELQERLLKERLAAADQSVIEMENEVARRRKEIALWEERVDQQLGLR